MRRWKVPRHGKAQREAVGIVTNSEKAANTINAGKATKVQSVVMDRKLRKLETLEKLVGWIVGKVGTNGTPEHRDG